MYYDIDHETYLTEQELKRDYETLKANGDTEMPTFNAYLKECLSNGCLEKINC